VSGGFQFLQIPANDILLHLGLFQDISQIIQNFITETYE